MFRSPKTFAYALQNIEKLASSEQNCVDDNCQRWFDTTAPMREMLHDLARREKGGDRFAPFVDIVCPHCGKKQFLIDPGKYDALNAKRPALQRYTFR